MFSRRHAVGLSPGFVVCVSIVITVDLRHHILYCTRAVGKRNSCHLCIYFRSKPVFEEGKKGEGGEEKGLFKVKRRLKVAA